MESEEGIVFFVPLAQAANIPLLGNLGTENTNSFPCHW